MTTTKLPSTSYIFVDRRKTARGKSIPNRQRLLRKIKDAIREAKPQDLTAGGVKNMSSGGSGNVNPVKVAKHSLHEPSFHYARHSGKHDIVVIGNKEYERGDPFPLDGEDEAGGGGGPGPDGEDDFIANVSKDEYLNVFFEDCELPNLVDNQAKELPEFVPKHAGFQKHGNPGQLSVKRSFKNSLGRRLALTKGARDEIEELKELLRQYEDGDHPDSPVLTQEQAMRRIAATIDRIVELERRVASTPYFEEVDLRYTKKEKVLVKAADAVFAMIMDVSGSMDEEKKRMARKFFSLQYAFIVRKYPQTDLIFIAHTSAAYEMTEDEFFTSMLSGGTIVTPAYEMLLKIINERYDSNETNIYLSQASDGDNWDTDNGLIIGALEESGLLAKLRHMSYVQVGQSYAGSYNPAVTLWTVIESIANTTKKISMAKINDDSEVFDAFHKIYKKKGLIKK